MPTASRRPDRRYALLTDEIDFALIVHRVSSFNTSVAWAFWDKSRIVRLEISSYSWAGAYMRPRLCDPATPSHKHRALKQTAKAGGVAASSVGKRTSVRTVARHHADFNADRHNGQSTSSRGSVPLISAGSSPSRCTKGLAATANASCSSNRTEFLTQRLEAPA
jgi:hypothetical protein